MSTRVVIEQPCEHGWEEEHWLNVDGSPIRAWQQGLNKTPCPGGTRRVVDPAEAFPVIVGEHIVGPFIAYPWGDVVPLEGLEDGRYLLIPADVLPLEDS